MTTPPASESEESRLDHVAGQYDPSDPASEFDYYLKRLQAKAIRTWLRGGRVLELGCATGELSSLLVDAAEDYDVVEGSARNIEVAAARVPGARFHHSLFETFTPEEPYSDVLIVCALEHVEDPVEILQLASGWLEPGGRIHVVVPNADSLHRHVGVAMGILGRTTDLSDSDVRIGHRRVYDIASLLDDVGKAGLAPLHWQGIFLKVISNAQMLGWDWALIHALDDVSQRFPADASELYVIAALP